MVGTESSEPEIVVVVSTDDGLTYAVPVVPVVPVIPVVPVVPVDDVV